MSIPKEPEQVMKQRGGSVLGKKTILKSDHFPGCQNKRLSPHIDGAPNYRQADKLRVHGVAIPTIDGIQNVLKHIGTQQTDGKRAQVLWINLREEPLVYINGRPFVLRDVERPFSNLEYTGINRARVEQMEARLKEDILVEAARYGNKILVTDELPDGQMVDQWEPVSRDSVKTPLEVYEELQVIGYLVDYERVPVTDEKSPKELDFDILVHKISQADINAEIIFNCQMGRGRTTTGMVIATLIYLNRIGASGIPRTNSIGKVSDSSVIVADNLPNSEDAIRRGEYAVIRSLIRVLEGGVEGKRQVDKVIDKCSSMQNLREAIATYRNSILRQPDEMKREASLSFFVEYLERYYFLICFAVYIHSLRSSSSDHSSFADWMKARPELYSIIRRLLRRDPMGALGYATLKPSLMKIDESADNRPSEMGVVAALRKGEVLGSQTVLKSDHCPGCQNTNLPERVDGAPNFREVPGFPVYGVANPTIDGIRSVIQRIGGSKGGRPIFWHNMREEPVIYINGKPFVLREVERPYKNMLEYTGIDRERVERMEARLKEDILREAEHYKGAIMVIHETEDGQIFDAWEHVDSGAIQTPLEVFKSLETDGFPIKYARVPITDGKAPKSSDFDKLAMNIASSTKATAFVFNCQMGRGRTTTGTVIACLLKLRIDYGRPIKILVDNIPSEEVDGGSSSGEETGGTSTASPSSVTNVRTDKEKGRVFGMNDILLLWKITRLFDNGVECREALDAIIDRCSALQNIRQAVLQYRRVFNQQHVEQRVRRVALNRGAEYLERYFRLIAFAAYLGSEAFDGFCGQGESRMTFKNWLHQRPEVQAMKWSIKLRPGRFLTVPEELRAPHEAQHGDAVMEAIIKNRGGSVLGKGSILKMYFFPGQRTSSHIQIHGAPHVYKVDGYPVYSMATPTIPGAKEMLAYLGAKPEAQGSAPAKVVLTDLREEAVVYINGTPFVLRELNKPVDTLKHVGITGPVVEHMEARLKEDILSEVRRSGSRMLLHREEFNPSLNQSSVIGYLENIFADDVKTPAEVYASLKDEGYNISYRRTKTKMEEYPEEMRSPPVSLVSVVGCPELHSSISTHLHSLDPPINTLALPDLSKVSHLLPPPKPNPADSSSAAVAPPAGILKRDWLLKHRTKVPAVVAALISSDRISGDPAQWLELCSEIDNLKGLLRGRSTKLVLVVVHSSSTEEISEDQMVAVRKRAEVDAKYLLTFYTGEDTQLKQSLFRLASVFAELAATYYRDEGRRIKARIERKSSGPADLNIRYSFKVAVYAEFRRDWVEALKFYEDAYHTLREVIAGASTRLSAIQRLVEIKTVAEQLHFKIATLLLHGGKIMEAVTWFRQHNASYRKLKGSPEAIFLHWEWMSRQFLVFAELLETSSGAVQSISHLTPGTGDRPLTEWEFRPAHYYQLAAHYLKEKRSSLDFAVSMSEGEIDCSAESVAPSSYLGQFARLIEEGDAFVMQPLTDEEYMRYAISEGKRFQDSFEIIALLKKSCESYNSLKVRRMASFCGFQMAREYYAADDFNNAKLLFDDIASLYRQEGWVTLLWEVLGYLREGSRKHSKVKEFIEYSFEMAALPISADTGIQSFRFEESGPAGPATLQQRETIHKEVFGLVSEKMGLASIENSDDVKISSNNPLHLEIDLVSPLRLVLLASVAFHEQMTKPGSSTLVTLSLLSQLPLTFEIDQLEVQFNQSYCNFVIMDAQKPHVASLTDGQSGRRRETAPSLRLSTNKWLRLTYDIKSDQSGKLECISVIAKMGPHFTICCRAESPASMDDLPLWKFEDRVITYSTKDPALAFSGQRAIQVEEPDPEVDLALGASGPALIGESFIIPVTVTSKGHEVNSGELKINLVDVRGGGLFSPRDAELSTESHHVELVGVSGSEGEDESQLNTDDIKKIQKAFGLVSVPNLKSGDSWSCKLEIKWYRPKPIMLFVSLGYSPDNKESNTQKVNVHKSLQIEGKNAITISHCLMLPFRRYPLLLSRTKPVPDSDQSVSMPLNETSVLIVSAKNCSEVPLQLLSLSIEGDNDDTERSCSLHGGEDLLNPALLVPGEKFKKVYTVTSEMNSSKLILGNVCLKWRRNSGNAEQAGSVAPVITTHRLPDVNLESSPLVVSLECPPYAILGDPFTYFVKIQNQTELLQEAKISLADAQSFVISGSHSDTVYILPKSEHIISYKLVPLSSGAQQLPRFTLTAVRYSTGFQPSIAASTIFVFPSQPQFKMVAVGDDRKESMVAE